MFLVIAQLSFNILPVQQLTAQFSSSSSGPRLNRRPSTLLESDANIEQIERVKYEHKSIVYTYRPLLGHTKNE